MREAARAGAGAPDLVPPDSLAGQSDEDIQRVEDRVRRRHDAARPGPRGARARRADELLPIREPVTEWKPHIVFNLLEEFHGISEFDQHVVSYLELLQVPYTGCNPRGLMLARDKALSKKIAGLPPHPRAPVRDFPRRHRVRRPRELDFPLIVKSLTEEASLGISQASIVDTDDEARRARRVRPREASAATRSPRSSSRGASSTWRRIGNERVAVLPVWELLFENLAPGAAAIATARVKHDARLPGAARHLPAAGGNLPRPLVERIERTTRRLYRLLHLIGYARIDYRLREDGELYFLEANPNPEIAPEEEFASAAAATGLAYPALLQKLLNLGLRATRW